MTRRNYHDNHVPICPGAGPVLRAGHSLHSGLGALPHVRRAAPDSSRVYCQHVRWRYGGNRRHHDQHIAAGGTNTPDTLVTDLPAPFSADRRTANQEPPLQNPVFLLTGQ